MSWPQNSAPTRRTVLSAIGTGVAATLVGTTVSGEQRGSSEYVLVQGDTCVPVEPIRGEKPVAAFYDYQLPEKYASLSTGGSTGSTAPYSSAGTTDLQRPQTSVAFLYRGPERLSLVVVHGSTDSQSGGSVTFRITGLPSGGEWLVADDHYRDPETGEKASTNYDNWSVDGTDHRIDWTWGAGGTDGGAFGGLGDEFEVVVHPAFNEAAALSGQHYEGTVTEWEFLSGADGQERISLGMDTALQISTGQCSTGAQTPTSTPTTEQSSGETGTNEETSAGQDDVSDDAADVDDTEEASEEREEAKEEADEEREEAKEEAEEKREEAKEEKEDWKEEKKEAKEELKEEKEDWKEKKREGKEDWKEEKEDWKEEKEEWKEEKKESEGDDD